MLSNKQPGKPKQPEQQQTNVLLNSRPGFWHQRPPRLQLCRRLPPPRLPMEFALHLLLRLWSVFSIRRDKIVGHQDHHVPKHLGVTVARTIMGTVTHHMCLSWPAWWVRSHK